MTDLDHARQMLDLARRDLRALGGMFDALSIREYNRLLEDLHDLAVVAERREESPVTLAEMKQRLAG